MKKALLLLASFAFTTAAFAQTTPTTEVKVRDNGTKKTVTTTGKTNVGQAIENTTDAAGNMPLAIDPKLAWALEHREQFPLDVNKATREQLLRVPGMGVKSVDRLIRARRHRGMRLDDLARLHLSLPKVMPWVVTLDHRAIGLDSLTLGKPPAEQGELLL